MTGAYSKEAQARRKGGAKPPRRVARPGSTLKTQAKPMRKHSETNGSLTGLSPADYYRDVRVPDVKRAIGDGRRPCGLMHELDGTLREIQPSPKCTGYVEGIHEVASRGRFGGLQPAVERGPTVDCCNACNRWWSEHSEESERAGLLMKPGPLFDQDEEEAQHP